MPGETIFLALIATLVPIYTLFINYRTNKVVIEQQKTIDKLTAKSVADGETIVKLIADLDGLPRRVAEQLANNILLTDLATDLRQQLIEAGVSLSEQPAPAAVEPLTPMTKEAEKLVEVFQEEEKVKDEKEG